MEKVKVKYLGKEDFSVSHGDVVEVFKPGDEREVPRYLADALLREESLERRWKKTGALSSEKRLPLFEEVEQAVALPETEELKNGETPDEQTEEGE